MVASCSCRFYASNTFFSDLYYSMLLAIRNELCEPQKELANRYMDPEYKPIADLESVCVAYSKG